MHANKKRAIRIFFLLFSILFLYFYTRVGKTISKLILIAALIIFSLFALYKSWAHILAFCVKSKK
jgi:hypothetical protein